MNRVDIQELRVPVSYPAITIIDQCNIERLREHCRACLQQAKDHPLAGHLERELEAIIEQIACPLKEYMIGIFINKHAARVYIIPYALPPMVHVSSTFVVASVVRALNRAQRAWVLDFNPDYPQLYEAHGALLLPVERSRAQFAQARESFDPVSEIPATCGIGEVPGAACRYPTVDELIKHLDMYVSRYVEQDPVPLVVVAQPEQEAIFKEVSRLATSVVAYVHTLDDAWAAVMRWYVEAIEHAFMELAHHADGKRVVSTLHDIEHAAREGRIEKLLVEHDYHRPGCEHGVTRALSPSQGSCPIDATAVDVIDELLEMVYSKGGQVLIVPNNTLDAYGRMVAFLRYDE